MIPEFKVTDFTKSLEFYTKLATFTVLYDRPEDDFAMLEMNSAKLMIEGFKGRTWLVGEMEKPFGRGMNLQIEVEDVQALYSRFKQARYPLFHEMEEKAYRVKEKAVKHRQFLVQDPDGYLLRFCQLLH